MARASGRSRSSPSRGSTADCMRMWKVRPGFLCNKHLLGEHVEMHMFAGVLRKGMGVSGYATKGLVEVHNIRKRHDALALKMLRRGMHHRSPPPAGPAFPFRKS